MLRHLCVTPQQLLAQSRGCYSRVREIALHVISSSCQCSLMTALAKTQGPPDACLDAISAARRDYSWHGDDSLGCGSFGAVYLATHRRTGTRVAVKIVSAPAEDLHWKREANILRELDHPNIIKLVADYPPGVYPSTNAGLTSPSAVMVFPVAHMDLRKFMLKRCGPRLSLPQAKSICRQMLEGLDYLHSQQVLHRDLKPSNVLVSVQDELHVWLCDFGLAKVATPASLNAATPLVQTRGYRSPEVVARMHLSAGPPLSPAMDMWSFGSCAIEILYSKCIFGSESAAKQMQMFVELLGPCPQQVLHQFDKWSDMISSSKNAESQLQVLLRTESPTSQILLRRCLAWNPSARPSAREALELTFFFSDFLPLPARDLATPNPTIIEIDPEGGVPQRDIGEAARAEPSAASSTPILQSCPL